MRLRGQGRFQHALQQCTKGWIARRVGSDHQGIREAPNQSFDVRAVAPGGRSTQDNVVLSGVAQKQRFERGEQCDEEGDPFLPA